MRSVAGPEKYFVSRESNVEPLDKVVIGERIKSLRKSKADALELINGAVAAVREATKREPRELGEVDIARALKSFERHSRESLMAALSVYDAVVTTLANSKVRDMHRFGLPGADEIPVERPVRMPALQKNAG